MKNKNLKILIIIFIILAGLLGLKNFLPKIKPETSFYQELVKVTSKQSIQNIEISKETESLQLKKEGGKWRVNNKKADAEKVDSLLTKLFPDINPELIAQTDKKHPEFELTNELATKIKLDDKLIILIGKSSLLGAFVRLDGDNKVFLLKDISSNDVSTSASNWYDKTILSLEQTKIQKLSFLQGGEKLILVKKEDEWFIEKEKTKVERDKVESILLNIASFVAQSLAEDADRQNYPKSPKLTLVIEHNGQKEELDFFQGKVNYLVKRQSDGEEFIVSETSATNFISVAKKIRS